MLEVATLGGRVLRRPPRISVEVAGGHRATVLSGQPATGLATVLRLAAVLTGLRGPPSTGRASSSCGPGLGDGSAAMTST